MCAVLPMAFNVVCNDMCLCLHVHLAYCYDCCGSLVGNFCFAAYLLLLLLLSCVVKSNSFSPPCSLIVRL